MTKTVESFNGKKLWMTLVFASILLGLIGIPTYDAFAHGQAPSTCPNRYDGPIMSMRVTNGTHIIDPIANPGAVIQVYNQNSYEVTFIIHTPSQSSQGNSDPGTTWYNTNALGFGSGACVYDQAGGSDPAIGPDQDVIISQSFTKPSNANPFHDGTQPVYFSTLVTVWPFVNYVVEWIYPNAVVPDAPTDLSATAVSSSQIDLSWRAPSNDGGSYIRGYKIERSTDGGTNWYTIVDNTGSYATTYSDIGLEHSTTYTYRVSAINRIGTGPPSNTASATTFHVVPSPPTGLTAIGKILQIDLSWNSPSDDGGTPIIGYKMERSTDGGNTWSTIVEDTGNTDTAYSDTNVLPLTTYTYRVSAINAIGTSDPSNTASAEILTISILPLSVQQLDLLEVL